MSKWGLGIGDWAKKGVGIFMVELAKSIKINLKVIQSTKEEIKSK